MTQRFAAILVLLAVWSGTVSAQVRPFVFGLDERVSFKPDGSYSKQITVRPKSDLRVLVDGKPARVRDLATGQEITAYVKVREPEIALAPADESESFEAMPIEEPEEQMAALPATASMLPLLGLLGGVSLLFGGLLSVIRYRRR